MSEHTPGPWTAEPQDPEGPLAMVEGTLIVAMRAPVGERVVAECGSPTRMEADARLIAAAPDLLEAAKAIIAGWDQTGAPLPGTWNHPLRAAIAKAEQAKSRPHPIDCEHDVEWVTVALCRQCGCVLHETDRAANPPRDTCCITDGTACTAESNCACCAARKGTPADFHPADTPNRRDG